MSSIRCIPFSALILVTGYCLANESSEGYVLRVDEGEKTEVPDSLIKASPKSGTNGGVVIQQGLIDGSSTGLHYHIEADEFFYITGGRGRVTIGEKEYKIGTGDFIFVPDGQDHRLTADEEGLEIIEFLDKPGLDEEFRTHFDDEVGLTLEQLNEVARKYGTVYKTLD